MAVFISSVDNIPRNLSIITDGEGRTPGGTVPVDGGVEGDGGGMPGRVEGGTVGGLEGGVEAETSGGLEGVEGDVEVVSEEPSAGEESEGDTTSRETVSSILSAPLPPTPLDDEQEIRNRNESRNNKENLKGEQLLRLGVELLVLLRVVMARGVVFIGV
jgi:hypothetical protein